MLNQKGGHKILKLLFLDFPSNFTKKTRFRIFFFDQTTEFTIAFGDKRIGLTMTGDRLCSLMTP